jgi:hypothetical protein
VRDRRRSQRRLTQAELRAMGATPGLMAHKVGSDGRARLEQLAPEGPERRRDFIRRLTNQDDVNEASEGG